MISSRPLLFILLVSIFGCKKLDHLNPLLPTNSEWLVPIANGTASLGTLSLLDSTNFKRNIPAPDLGFPIGVNINVPAFTYNHLGPYPIVVSDWVKEIHVHTLAVSLSLTNSFPIIIGAGTTITIRNGADTLNTQNIITQQPISNDVLPGETFSINFQLSDKVIEDTVFLYLDNFNSSAQNNVTFTNNSSQIVIGLNVIAVDEVKFYTDRTKSIRDTSDFEITNQSSTSTIEDSTIAGHLKIFMDNALPLNAGFQIYFLDASKRNVIDSLFDTQIILQGAQTNSAGSPLEVTHSIDSIKISAAHLSKIKQSKYAVTVLDMNTFNSALPFVTANNETYLNIQITGDLKMNFKL